MSIFQEALRTLEEPPVLPEAPPVKVAPVEVQPGITRPDEEPDEGLSLMDGLVFCVMDQPPQDQMTCLATMVAAPDDERCPDHLVMLTQAGCPYCAEAKAKSQALLDEGKVIEVDIFSDRGKALAGAAGIDFTPGLLVVGCDDRVRAVLDNPLHPRLVWREDTGPFQERSEDDGEEDNGNDGNGQAMTPTEGMALGPSAQED